MKAMQKKLASLGLALIMAMTMILSNVGIANVQAADTVTVNGESKEVVARVTLTPGYTVATLVQFGNVYDFGVENNGRLGFSGTLKLDGEALEAESQFYFSGYENNTTICLNFGSAHQDKLLTIEKDSVIYSGNKAVVVSETFNMKWIEGTGWTVPAPAPKDPEKLTISGVHWGNDTVLMLKSNLPLSLGSIDSAEAKNLNEEGSAQVSSRVRTTTLTDAEPNEQLLVIDFATAYEKNTNYVLKKGSSVTFAGTEYILDNDVAAYFDGTNWKNGTAPVPEKLTISGVHWGNDTVLMLKSNLPLSLGSIDSAEAKNLNEEGSAQVSSRVRTTTLTDAEPNEQLLVIDFATAYEKNTNYVLKKGSSVTFAGTEYILDNDVKAYFDGVNWKEGTAPEEIPTPEPTPTPTPTPKPEPTPTPKPVHTHKYVKTVVKATTSKAGSITEKCSCGKVKSKTTINAASKITLSKTSVTYNKKTQKISVKVKDSKGKTISTSQYKVSGTLSAKKVGTYKVKITLKGNYSGSKTLTWKINPKSTKVTSVKAGSKSLTVKWSKQTTETKGYKIQVSTDKNFKKNVKTVTISKNKTTSKKITGLKKNKKYYVRICTYKGSNTSAWTKYSKSVKVK